MKLKCGKSLGRFPFNIKLRHYTKDAELLCEHATREPAMSLDLAERLIGTLEDVQLHRAALLKPLVADRGQAGRCRLTPG